MKSYFQAFEDLRISAFVKVNMKDFQINKSSNHNESENSIIYRIYNDSFFYDYSDWFLDWVHSFLIRWLLWLKLILKECSLIFKNAFYHSSLFPNGI